MLTGHRSLSIQRCLVILVYWCSSSHIHSRKTQESTCPKFFRILLLNIKIFHSYFLKHLKNITPFSCTNSHQVNLTGITHLYFYTMSMNTLLLSFLPDKPISQIPHVFFELSPYSFPWLKAGSPYGHSSSCCPFKWTRFSASRTNEVSTDGPLLLRPMHGNN